MRLRLPPGFERIEPPARQAMQKRFSRGNFQATLTIVRAAGSHDAAGGQRGFSERSGRAGQAAGVDQFGVDAGQRRRAAGAARRARRARNNRDATRCAPPPMPRSLSALDAALAGLEAARQSEGAALDALLARPSRSHRGADAAGRSRSVARAGGDPPAHRRAGAAAARCRPTASTKTACTWKPRCLPTKADIREEIDRLKTHVASARALLASRRRRRPQARFSGTGIQPRIEYSVLEIECRVA